MQTNILKMITLADIASLANGLCGFLSIIAILQYNVILSAQLLFLAVVFDAIDGTLARYFATDNVEHIIFGQMMDSLSDVISFGVAPAVIIYMLTGQLYMLIPASLLVICGILRLSRYNTISAYEDGPTTTFIGLPIPISSFVLAAFMLSSYNIWLLFVVMIVIALLMVSNIEYPKISEMPIIAVLAILILLACIPVINNALYKLPAYIIWVLGLLYIVGIIVISLYDNQKIKNNITNISDFTNNLNKR